MEVGSPLISVFFGRVLVGWLHCIGQNLEGQGHSGHIERNVAQEKNVALIPK